MRQFSFLGPIGHIETVNGIVISRTIAYGDVVSLIDGQAMPLLPYVIVKAGMPDNAPSAEPMIFRP
jgi:hypothetical protein